MTADTAGKASLWASVLVRPRYPLQQADGRVYRPGAREALAEWLDAINVLADRRRGVALATAAFHLFTGAWSLAYFTYYLTWESIPSRFFSVGLGLWFGLFYTSVWWHRYCTHKAFTFRSLIWPRLIGWTNPLCYRDETFVIPHRLHHEIADAPGDPYTPHSGWLACYLSAEVQQRTTVAIPKARYEVIAKSLRHTGNRLNTYEEFQRTGSIEHVGVFFARALVAQVLWVVPLALFGGTMWVAAFYSAVFWCMAMQRDFNYRGHSRDAAAKARGWNFGPGESINHRLYGYMSGEWHNNHHACPGSARMGFLRTQPDAGFLIIRLLHAVGIVNTYRDQRAMFEAAYRSAGSADAARRCENAANSHLDSRSNAG